MLSKRSSERTAKGATSARSVWFSTLLGRSHLLRHQPRHPRVRERAAPCSSCTATATSPTPASPGRSARSPPLGAPARTTTAAAPPGDRPSPMKPNGFGIGGRPAPCPVAGDATGRKPTRALVMMAASGSVSGHRRPGLAYRALCAPTNASSALPGEPHRDFAAPCWSVHAAAARWEHSVARPRRSSGLRAAGRGPTSEGRCSRPASSTWRTPRTIPTGWRRCRSARRTRSSR